VVLDVCLPPLTQITHEPGLREIRFDVAQESGDLFLDASLLVHFLRPYNVGKGQPKEHIVNDSKRSGIQERNQVRSELGIFLVRL